MRSVHLVVFLSAVLVSVGCSAGQGPDTSIDRPTVESTPVAATPVSGDGPVEGALRNYTHNTWYVAERDEFTGSLDTWVGVASEQNPALFYLNMACYQGALWFAVLGADLTYEELVTYRIDARVLVKDELWGTTADREDPGLESPDPGGLIESLRGAQRFEFRIGQHDETTLTFDIRDLFSTRVQPNIDNCGKEGWR